MSGVDEQRVLVLASRASADGGLDPVDSAVQAAARRSGTQFTRSARLHRLRPSPSSKTPRNRWSIASRARKTRERTVPTGQDIAAATCL